MSKTRANKGEDELHTAIKAVVNKLVASDEFIALLSNAIMDVIAKKKCTSHPTAHIILDAEAETPETTIESEEDHTGKIKNTPKLMQQKKTTNAPEATEGNRKQSKPATTQIQTLAQEK
ncbi:hypothetical protein JTB14_032644 [Gonioctena quinquepunctata]|nr:hypothetical protein JTB14_032644 [Gonioctena quinquepunctata]